MEHIGSPSDETLAAFLDGRLDPGTRETVIAHMVTCSECYSVFAGVSEMEVAAQPKALSRSTRRTWLGVAAMVVAVASLFLAASFRGRLLLRGDDGLTQLARAAPPQRIIAGRISGFPYQPMAPVTRGARDDPMKNPSNSRLMTAAAGVQRAATARPSVPNLHALGVAILLLGNGDAAIDTMHQALLAETRQRIVTTAISESNDAPLLSDLSAALSNRAAAHRKMPDAVEALRCADRAWRLSSTPETAWNRAVAIESLNGSKGARTAWHDYLAIDPGSPWSAEARRKLAE